MNIKEMTIGELKALAYDQVVIIETARGLLLAINQEIQTRNEVKNHGGHDIKPETPLAQS